MIFLRRDNPRAILRVLAIDWHAHQSCEFWRFLLGSVQRGKYFSSEWYALRVLALAGWYPSRLTTRFEVDHGTLARREYLLKIAAYSLALLNTPRNGQWYGVRQTRHWVRWPRERAFRELRKIVSSYPGLTLCWRWHEGLCCRWKVGASSPSLQLPEYVRKVLDKSRVNPRLALLKKAKDVEL